MQSFRRSLVPSTLIAVVIIISTMMTSGTILAQTETKLIEFGWNTPYLQDMPKFIESAQALPFDGAVLDIRGSVEGSWGWEIFSDHNEHRYGNFRDVVNQFKDFDWGSFDTHFLRLNVTEVDFWDDWEIVLKNVETWARVAHDLGFVGILLDTEQYGDNDIFEYPLRTYRDQYSFEQYSQRAYERGQEVIQALNRGYPDLTVMMTFGVSVTLQCCPAGGHEAFDYGLLVPFVQGMIDAAPDSVTLVDGTENAYVYESSEQFANSANHIRDLASKPEQNEAGMKVGFGLWIDPSCKILHKGYEPTEDCQRSYDNFAQALASALHHSDSYVWIYSQHLNWYTGKNVSNERLISMQNARTATPN